MGAGRKPKPPGEKQSEIVSVYLTPAERANLERAAGQEPIAGFVRRIMLRYLARHRK